MFSPARLLVILTAAVFTAELSIMTALTFFPPLPQWIENTLDAFLLVILLTPILYFWIFKPLSLLVSQQMLMGAELESANKMLQHDIAERMGFEESLRQSSIHTKSLLNSVAEGIYGVDMHGNCTFINPAGLRLLGYQEDTELIGKHMHELIHHTRTDGSHYPTAECRLYHALYSHENIHVDDELFWRKDGSSFPVDYWSCPTINIDEVDGAVITFLDITERKRIKQELIILNNQLTQEVAKRTSDLSALTAHVQKVAEAERARLARELHDEMGSTLVALSMEVGRLKGKASDPELLHDLSMIKELLTNATKIKQNVVSQLYPTVLDTYGFVAAVEWLVKEYIKHSGINVELIMPKEEIVMEQTFSLAAFRITQECLTNIAKHAGADTVHIEAKVSNGFLDLTIHDNGKGLPDDVKTGGHGIFGMIERAHYLGGSMEIGSDIGKGATAHLHLPLASPKQKNKKKVLVVDDHAIVRNALRQLMDREADEFSVEGEAADGQTAIQMAIEGVWDLILLDINLPKIDGITVLEEVKAVKPRLPIIMLSSHEENKYGEIALSKGAACYIEKGETSKLLEAMRQAMQHEV